MRIGINALFLQKPATGSGQHLFHLLEGLDAYDKENTYVLLSPRFRRAYSVAWPHLSDRFRNVEVVSALALGIAVVLIGGVLRRLGVGSALRMGDD